MVPNVALEMVTMKASPDSTEVSPTMGTVTAPVVPEAMVSVPAEAVKSEGDEAVPLAVAQSTETGTWLGRSSVIVTSTVPGASPSTIEVSPAEMSSRSSSLIVTVADHWQWWPWWNW